MKQTQWETSGIVPSRCVCRFNGVAARLNGAVSQPALGYFCPSASPCEGRYGLTGCLSRRRYVAKLQPCLRAATTMSPENTPASAKPRHSTPPPLINVTTAVAAVPMTMPTATSKTAAANDALREGHALRSLFTGEPASASAWGRNSAGRGRDPERREEVAKRRTEGVDHWCASSGSTS